MVGCSEGSKRNFRQPRESRRGEKASSSTFTNSVYDIELPNSRQIRRKGRSEKPSIGERIKSPRTGSGPTRKAGAFMGGSVTEREEGVKTAKTKRPRGRGQ